MGVRAERHLRAHCRRKRERDALALATTIVLKNSRPLFALAPALPLAWLLSVTMTAGMHKIWNPDRRIGFLAQAEHFAAELAAGGLAPGKAAELEVLVFNNRLDAAVTALFMLLVTVVVADAARVWWQTLRPNRGAPAPEVARGEVTAGRSAPR